MSGSARWSSSTAVLKSRRERGGVGAGTGAGRAASASRRRGVGGDLEIVSCSALGSALIAASVVPRSPKSLTWVLETGARRRRRARCRGRTRASRSRGLVRLAATGVRCLNSGGSDWIVRLRSSPRPANAPPKPTRFLRELRRVLASNSRQHVLELDRHARLLGGQRRPVGEGLLRLAADDLDVLEAEGRARADDDLRVDRERALLLVELELEVRADRAVGLRGRRDVLDDADAEAALADLVALDELGAVLDVHVELAGGHERQAVVRVVGEEHRDDDHEDRDGPDEHGVGGDR